MSFYCKHLFQVMMVRVIADPIASRQLTLLIDILNVVPARVWTEQWLQYWAKEALT